jgi:uncharacterized protein (DUF2141 family)
MNSSDKVRVLLIGILTALATLTTYGQDMTVVIKNVQGDGGMVRLALYNSNDQFMKTEIKAAEIKSVNGEAIAVLKDVKPGTYAISVMHDANDNKELDSNMFGIPKEGFGFSNDAMGMFGPPDFKKASFQYSGKNEVVINLRYM